MMKYLKATLLIAISLQISSCIKEPKERQEQVTSSDEYEKVVDGVIGAETIFPDDIKVGQQDVMVQTMTISNSMIRERFRRQFKVVDIQKSGNQTQFKFQVTIIKRDEKDNPEPPSTVVRTLIMSVSADGYYQFVGDGDEYTVFSWDQIIGLRGFCQSYETEKVKVDLSCTSVNVEAATYGKDKIPVRKLSLNRAFSVTDKTTGETDSGKLRYVFQIGSGVQEISRVLSSCVEGLQKVENNVYYLVNCNNIESL